MVPPWPDVPAFAPVDAALFLGVPGGMELLVIVFMAIVMFGLPVVLLGGGLYLYRRSQSDRPANNEIAALRREVELLREEINRLDDEQERDGRSGYGREGDRRDRVFEDDRQSNDEP